MILSIRRTLSLLLTVAATKIRIGCDAWVPSHGSSRNPLTSMRSTPSPNDLPWNGEVVANTNDGRISGCSVTPVGGPPTVEWEITIDGYVVLFFVEFSLFIASHKRIFYWNNLIICLAGWMVNNDNDDDDGDDDDDDDDDNVIDNNQCRSGFR